MSWPWYRQWTSRGRAEDEQRTGSEETLDAVGRLKDITAKVRSGSSEMLADSKHIISRIEDLGSITTDVTASVKDMTLRLQRIAEAMNNVSENTRKNKECINALMAEVGRFRA